MTLGEDQPAWEENMDLLTAVRTGDEKKARALVAGGVKIDGVLKQQCSALGFAAAAGDLPAVKLLLALGASTNPKKAAESPLEMALGGEEAVFEDIALVLLEHGADPNVNEAAPLRSAIIYGFDRAVEAMLARGADAKLGELVGDAAGAGSLRWVKRLIELGADPDAGWAMGQAMREGHLDVLAFLLARAPDFNLKKFFHYDFERASGPMAELVKKYVQWGEPELGDLLVEAILDGGEELGLFALNGVAELDRVGTRGIAALHAAVLAQRQDWVERLLEKGAASDALVPATTKHNSLEIAAGTTPLALAKQIRKSVKAARGDESAIAAIEERLATLAASKKKPASRGVKGVERAVKLPPRPKGPPWRVAIDDVLVRVAEAGDNDVAALLRGLTAIDVAKLDSWAYLCAASKRCAGDLHSEAVLEKLAGTLLARVLDDRLFEGDEWDDVKARYYPKEARTAIKKGFVLSAWDADLFVEWPAKAGEAGRICRAHPESFTVLAGSLVELLQREVASL
jgi:ankyrin repeat protein